MLDIFDDEDKGLSPHDEAIDDDIDAAMRDPLVDIPFADHTNRRPDPGEINGRKPDEIRVNRLTGEATAVEIETDPGSSHSQQQAADLQEGADNLGMDFELEPVDDTDTWL